MQLWPWKHRPWYEVAQNPCSARLPSPGCLSVGLSGMQNISIMLSSAVCSSRCTCEVYLHLAIDSGADEVSKLQQVSAQAYNICWLLKAGHADMPCMQI